MGMTREELELAVGGEPGGGGMSLWSDEMEDDVDGDIAALEEEIATFDLDAEYDPETGCYMTAAGIPIEGNSGLKIIFRRLPPKINEHEFLEITGLNKSDYNYFCLKNPSRYDSFDPEDRSVAFVNFVDPDLGNYYLERFDGFQFIDKSGNDYYSTTTQAPFQAIPRIISKIDPMEGTVLETEDFSQFLRRYEHGDQMFGVYPKYEDGLEMCELYLQELEEKRRNPPKNESSPLVEYFKELRKEERLTGKRLVDRKALPRVRAARKSLVPNERQREIETYLSNNEKIHARNSTAKKRNIPQGPTEIIYDESFPRLSQKPSNSEFGLGPCSEAISKWSSFSWRQSEEGEDGKPAYLNPTRFPCPRQTRPKPKKKCISDSSQPNNPNPASCQEFVEPVEEYFSSFEDKRKEDRKERRERERKEKRTRRKSKYEEDKGKQLNSLSEIPEKEEGDGASKGENEIPTKKDISTPKETESMTPAASSNSIKETKQVKKPIEEKAPFPRRGNNFPNKNLDSKSKVGPTKYGPNSYSNSKEKDSPRYPNKYNDKKPQIEKSDETNRGDEQMKHNRNEEKSWRKNGNVRNQRGGWDRESRENRDRWDRPGRDRWSKDKERSSNNTKSTTEDDSKSSANTSNKENEKSDTSTKTETIPEIKILQKEKVTVTVTDQVKSDTIKQEKIKTERVEEPDSGSKDKSEPRKTIIKIVKVRKQIPRADQPAEEGKRHSAVDSGRIRAKDGGASTIIPSRQGEKERVRRIGPDSQKPSPSPSVRTNEATTKDSKTEIEDKDKRVRKARPDIQIYRPGSWRQSTTTKAPGKPQTAGNGNGSGNGNDGSSTASKD